LLVLLIILINCLVCLTSVPPIAPKFRRMDSEKMPAAKEGFAQLQRTELFAVLTTSGFLHGTSRIRPTGLSNRAALSGGAT
jgi:hypothetical protein